MILSFPADIKFNIRKKYISERLRYSVHLQGTCVFLNLSNSNLSIFLRNYSIHEISNIFDLFRSVSLYFLISSLQCRIYFRASYSVILYVEKFIFLCRRSIMTRSLYIQHNKLITLIQDLIEKRSILKSRLFLLIIFHLKIFTHPSMSFFQRCNNCKWVDYVIATWKNAISSIWKRIRHTWTKYHIDISSIEVFGYDSLIQFISQRTVTIFFL